MAGTARALRWQGVLVLVLAALLVLAWLVPSPRAFDSLASYVWLHLALETVSILMAGMAFGLAWNAYSRERPGNIILIAIGLFVSGMIDFMHALSFKGMPQFVTAADPEKAINFWLAARLTFAMTFTAAALRGWAPLRRPSLRYVWLAAGVLATALIAWCGLVYPQSLPRTYIAGHGLTVFKIAAECTLIALLAVPATIFLRDSRLRRGFDAPTLFAAAAVSMLSELSLTLYADVADNYNLIGHIYKIVAYALLYRAVLVGSVRAPFERAIRAEATMRAASSYVRSLIEASLDPLVLISPEGKISDVNQAAEIITGLNRTALIGTEFSRYFTDPDMARMGHRTVLEEGLVHNYALTIRHVSGKEVDVLCNASAYRDRSGHIEGVVAAARDITEMRRTERALQRQRTLLSKIAETSPIGITVWDTSGKIKFANAEAERLLGRAKDQIRNPVRTAPDWAIMDFSGNTLTDGELPFSKAMATGEPVYDAPMAIEGPCGKKTLLSVNASPLLSEAGHVEGVVATLEDMTQRKAAEERLHASEQRLKLAMNAAHMGAWNWDVVNDSVSYSEEFSVLMGLPRGVSHPNRAAVLAAIHPGDRERVARALEQGLIKERGYWVDFRIIWPDQSLHWLSVHASITHDAAGKPLKMSGIGMDITDRKQGEIALNRANRGLRSLSAANERLIHAHDESELLNAVCRVIVDVGGYRMAWVGKALHDERRTVQRIAQYGDDGGFIELAQIVWADSAHGWCPTGAAIRTGTTQINQNYATNALLLPWREEALKRGYLSSIAFPLRDESGVHSALTIYAAEPDAFNDDEVKLLQELADDLAFGIGALRTGAAHGRMAQEQLHHETRLRDSLVKSIQAIAATLELRDPYTAGHQRRVASLAKEIAREMGLSEMQIQGLHLAAAIHDVGKIHIPAEILNKPGRLSSIEMELIRTHAQAGYDILKDIEFPWPIARIVLEHHEHIDGSGYPNRLRGDQLLPESKILSVADVVEAMISHRPYRPGLGVAVALEDIARHRGSWYDPDVVDTCLKLFRESRYGFE